MKAVKSFPFNYSQYMMLHAVVGYCTSAENQPVTNLVPSFAASIESIESKIAEIEVLIGLSNQNLTGITADKKALKKSLALFMMEISGPVCAFATATGNNDLLKVAQSSYTRNLETRDTLLVAKALNLAANVTPYLTSLGNYNITSATLTQLQTLCNSFGKAIPANRIKSVERSGSRQQRSQLLKQAMDITRTLLDPLANTLSPSGSNLTCRVISLHAGSFIMAHDTPVHSYGS